MAKKPPAPWMNPKSLNPKIRDYVNQIKVIDTHEHLDEESVRLKQPNNLTPFFMYYSFAELVSAGLPVSSQKAFFNDKISGKEQWKLIRDYWPLAKHSAFCRAVTLSTQELYGIDDLTDASIEPLLKAREEMRH
jgi:hypothetical protein